MQRAAVSLKGVYGTELPAILSIRFMDPRRLCWFPTPLQKAVIPFSAAAPALKKAGRCHVTADAWSSGQSVACFSQRFGQPSSTNSFSLPSSPRSTTRKLASLCAGEFFTEPRQSPRAGDALPILGSGVLPSWDSWGYFLGPGWSPQQSVRIRSLNTGITRVIMWNN